MNRRDFIKVTVSAGLTSVFLPGCLSQNSLQGSSQSEVVSDASSKQSQPQVAGFYRTKVGDFEVTTLSDGIILRPVDQQADMLFGDKAKSKEQLMRAYPDGQVKFTVNAFLINTGSKLVLIDSGYGKMGGPTTGKVIDNLRAAGYQPEQINEVYLTHLHIDHVGGLVAGTERVFPNATVVYANKRDAEFWLNNSKQTDALKQLFQAAQNALTPYIIAGKFKTFDGDTSMLPGIRTQTIPGHTPGHTGYFIESKGKTLFLWGDTIIISAVQFENPSVAIVYDLNRPEAEKTRRQMLADAVKNGWLIGGAHFALPSIGYVRNQNNVYTFLPLGDPGLQ